MVTVKLQVELLVEGSRISQATLDDLASYVKDVLQDINDCDGLCEDRDVEEITVTVLP